MKANSSQESHASQESQSCRVVLPHSGYRKLIAYRKSEVIYQGTVAFCRRFLPPRGDRTVDQMTQAARSCKQNIAEGSAAAGVSLETQLKLTGVAKASLDELLEDVHDWLTAHGEEEWNVEDARTASVRAFAREHESWEDWRDVFETRSAGTLCNVLMVLIHQCRHLLERMIVNFLGFDTHSAGAGVMARAGERAASWAVAAVSAMPKADKIVFWVAVRA